MADEQAPVTEVVPTEVEAPAEPAVVEEPPAEVKTEPDRGDPRVAMQEERKKRQEYERLANDPNWVYEQAKRLGLADSPEPLPTPAATSNGLRPEDVDTILDFRETVRDHPEFDPAKGDQALVKWAATLVNDGHKPSEAVDIILKTVSKMTATKAGEIANAAVATKQAAEVSKINADVLHSSTQGDTDQLKMDELVKTAKNWKDPKAQEAAQLEILKLRMR